jgi:hypothetical protein
MIRKVMKTGQIEDIVDLICKHVKLEKINE